MRNRNVLLAIVVLFGARVAGPARAEDAAAGAAGPFPRIIRILNVDPAALPAAIVARACSYWEPTGIRCMDADASHPPDLVMVPSARKCPKAAELHAERGDTRKGTVDASLGRRPGCTATPPSSDDSYYVLAVSTERVITVYVDCFAPKGVLAVPPDLNYTVAHELGHEFGFPDHVPKACDDPCVDYRTAPDGERICGESVLNVGQHPLAEHATPADIRVFGARNPALWLMRGAK